MTSKHLGLPFIEAAQAQKHVTHNEALVILDALAMLSVIDRDLSSPPASPAEGDRYLVKPAGGGAFAGKDHQVAHFLDGGWSFYPPAVGWLVWVADEAALLAWNGAAWAAVSGGGGGPIGELQNLARLGVGAAADATNPFTAKLNNALWVAKSVADGGDGDLRYKLSKESAAKTLSILFQDNYSGRAEIGLAGDDDFHFKTSPDGSTWFDALLFDRATGATKINSGFFLTGDMSPAQITADQNDYNPAGLATASVLRLSSDASRVVTGLSGGGDGRALKLLNVGAHEIVLKDQSASSSAGNRFLFGADVTLAANQAIELWYDAAVSRWRPGASRWDFGTAARKDVGAIGAVVPLLNAANTWSAAQTVNLNAAAPQAPLAGTVLHIAGVDGSVARIAVDGYGGPAVNNLRRANGSAASPSGVLSGDTIGTFAFQGYGASAYISGVVFRATAVENFTNTATGSRASVETCAIGSATPAPKFEVGPTGVCMTKGTVRVATQFDKTSDVTLANVTGLTVNVEASRSYRFKARLYTTSNSSGGVKAAIGGTATATAIIYEALTFNSAAISAQTRATALATAVGGVTAVTAALIEIEGTIAVNAAGTLTVQFAQNASNGAASSVLVGSYFEVWEIGA